MFQIRHSRDLRVEVQGLVRSGSSIGNSEHHLAQWVFQNNVITTIVHSYVTTCSDLHHGPSEQTGRGATAEYNDRATGRDHRAKREDMPLTCSITEGPIGNILCHAA